jgi:hypothetical protein
MAEDACPEHPANLATPDEDLALARKRQKELMR